MQRQQLEKKPMNNSAKIIRVFFIALVLIIVGTIITVLIQPKRTDPHTLGLAAYLDGDYQGAVTYFSAAIAQNPSLEASFMGRGQAYIKLGRLADAQNDFIEAARLAPDDIQPLYQLGIIGVGLGEIPEALEYFNVIIERQPDYAPAYFQRGYAYAQNGDYLLAISDYTAAIALDDTVADFYRALGDAHYELDNTAQALAAYERYIQLDEAADTTAFQRVQELRNRQ